MEQPSIPAPLVERKKYDPQLAQNLAPGIWWVGYIDAETVTSHNPYLLIDEDEAVLINPGSRADEHCRIVRDKVASLIEPRQIRHIVILHHDPDRCGSVAMFEKLADRNVRIYAPKRITKSITYYGCKNPVIPLDDSDSIILKSGRSLEYIDTPKLATAGLGMLFDSRTRTLFCGNVFGCLTGEWNLFAPHEGWKTLVPGDSETYQSKKAVLHALNRIERLSPEQICPHCGPIIEEEIDKYLETVRKAYVD
jgi:two-component system cell cycle response regulator